MAMAMHERWWCGEGGRGLAAGSTSSTQIWREVRIDDLFMQRLKAAEEASDCRCFRSPAGLGGDRLGDRPRGAGMRPNWCLRQWSLFGSLCLCQTCGGETLANGSGSGQQRNIPEWATAGRQAGCERASGPDGRRLGGAGLLGGGRSSRRSSGRPGRGQSVPC
jgi:hypothetical protein